MCDKHKGRNNLLFFMMKIKEVMILLWGRERMWKDNVCMRTPSAQERPEDRAGLSSSLVEEISFGDISSGQKHW